LITGVQLVAPASPVLLIGIFCFFMTCYISIRLNELMNISFGGLLYCILSELR